MNCAPGSPQPSVTSTVDSTPLPTANPSVGSSYGIDAFQKYLGCFNDTAGGVRTLNSISYSSYKDMTVGFCQQYCKARGYRLAGVEYAQECHCDNFINPTAVTGTRQCGSVCGGTLSKGGQQEICGGVQSINVYNNTDPSFDAFGDNGNSAGGVQPPRPLAPLPANYVGCVTDNRSGRTLTGPTAEWSNMTAAVCSDFCTRQGGYQYYGVEFGTQCFCGNTIAGTNFITNATSNPSDNICSMRCRTAGDQNCGGPNALSMYKNVNYKAPSLTRPIGKYANKGCLTDPNNGKGRALQGISTNLATNSADSCVKYCLGNRYRYAGVEYGTECYCSNAISFDSGAVAQTCDVSKLTLCPGNKSQYCGAGSLLVLYYSATL